MIRQVIVKFAVAINLAAVVPGLPDQLRLPSIFLSPLTQRTLLPSIEAAGLAAKAPTHRPHPELVTMLGNKRVSHFASLAKYAVAFFRMSRSSVTRVSSRFNWRISAYLPVLPDTSARRCQGRGTTSAAFRRSLLAAL
jgi:hypothetical protein